MKRILSCILLLAMMMVSACAESYNLENMTETEIRDLYRRTEELLRTFHGIP